jgi:hypothetical protein
MLLTPFDAYVELELRSDIKHEPRVPEVRVGHFAREVR